MDNSTAVFDFKPGTYFYFRYVSGRKCLRTKTGYVDLMFMSHHPIYESDTGSRGYACVNENDTYAQAVEAAKPKALTGNDLKPGTKFRFKNTNNKVVYMRIDPGMHMKTDGFLGKPPYDCAIIRLMDANLAFQPGWVRGTTPVEIVED